MIDATEALTEALRMIAAARATARATPGLSVRAMADEPARIAVRRAPLIAGFAAVKQAALDADAMGASISGAGPSVFAWCEDENTARRAGVAMTAAFAAAGIDSDLHLTAIAGPAARVLA